jgi:nucleotide-binding universal stress UspA family protein
MRKILLPCDGSDNSLRAVQYAATLAQECPAIRLELLNVQDPVPQNVYAVMSPREVAQFQAEAADVVLRAAKQILDTGGIRYQTRYGVGPAAIEIARQVHEGACDAVMMGSRGLGLVAVVIGSVATKVIHLVDVPVILIK